MSLCTKYCDPCFYYVASDQLCTYYNLNGVGHRRPCPAGDGCTVRITKREYLKMNEQKKRTRTSWTPEMISDLRRYRSEGLDCTQIADRMGLDLKVVQNKVVNMKLPTPKEKSPIKPPAESTDEKSGGG